MYFIKDKKVWKAVTFAEWLMSQGRDQKFAQKMASQKFGVSEAKISGHLGARRQVEQRETFRLQDQHLREIINN